MATGQAIEATFTAVGTGWSSVEILGPAKYQILRARATIESGSGTQVALRVSQKLDTDRDIKLEYGLTTGDIDSIEAQDSIYIYTKKRDPKVNGNGYTAISVKVDTGSNSTVFVALDIEPIN